MADCRAVVLILSHGRAETATTPGLLKRSGYTGDWFILLDNEDATYGAYARRFGEDRLIVFDKREEAARTDTGDLSEDRRVGVFARNASFRIARERGYTHLVQLDDDYKGFHHRYEKAGRLGYVDISDFDSVARAMFEFLDASGAAAVAFGQGGDMIGGIAGTAWRRKLLRKTMNAWFVRTDVDWRFMGRMNDDVSTYTLWGHRGLLFLTTMYATLVAETTQKLKGGMTEVYLETGTYAKSFYSVMMIPSAVRVSVMDRGVSYPRIHHEVWGNACQPRILPETYRKMG